MRKVVSIESTVYESHHAMCCMSRSVSVWLNDESSMSQKDAFIRVQNSWLMEQSHFHASRHARTDWCLTAIKITTLIVVARCVDICRAAVVFSTFETRKGSTRWCMCSISPTITRWRCRRCALLFFFFDCADLLASRAVADLWWLQLTSGPEEGSSSGNY